MELYKHTTDYQISKIKNYSPVFSPSMKLNQKKKKTLMEDYGVKLPDADIKRNRLGDSEEPSDCENDLQYSLTIRKQEHRLD